MYTKKNARITFKSNRRNNYKKSNYSNSKGRNKGNITQQYNKYLKLAKEASSSGDKIQSEYYYQFTDHYFRLMIEQGISFEDLSENPNVDNELSPKSLDENDTNKNLNEDSNTEENAEESDESIESISFIAKPPKEKRARSTK
tara:strand:- start:156 stop:584 length:429 start_codon:yes stop_codon:yes gene_type:complete